MQDGVLLSAGALNNAIAFRAKEVFFGGEFGLGYKRYKYRNSSTGEVEVGFGHAGAGGSIGLAFPHRKVAFALTVNRPIQDAEPRNRILKLVCNRLGVGEALDDMDGVN